MGKNDVVETGVDSLIKLVKAKGRISVSDAAKELNAEQKTVEKWIDFLVEEEKLGMDYKFTTPYVFFIDQKKSSDNLSISKEEFQKMGGKTQDGKKEINEDDKIANKKAEEKLARLLNPEKAKANRAESPIEHIKELFMQIESLLMNKQVEKAHNFYNQVKKYLVTLPNTEENEFLNKKMIEINELFLSAIKTLSEELESESKQIDFLLNQGNEYLEKTDLVSAKKTYSQLLEIYSKIPSIFIEQKKMLYNNIFEFYKSLITNEYSHSLSVIEQGEEQISGIIIRIETFLEQGNIDEANATFSEINKIYGSLPHGFLEQKLKIHTKILKLYEELKISNKVRDLHQELLKLNSKVAKTFEPQPKQFLAQNNIAERAPSLPDVKTLETSNNLKNAEIPFPNIEEKNAKGELLPSPPPAYNSTKKDSDSKLNNQNSIDPIEQLKSMNITQEKSSLTNDVLENKTPEHPNMENVNLETPPDLMTQESLPNEEISLETSVVKNEINNDNHKILEKTIDSKKESIEPISKAMTEEQLFNKAMTAYNQKQYDEAKSIFDQLYQENPRNVKAKEMSELILGIVKNNPGRESKSKLIKAISAASIGNFDNAKKELNEILSQDPNNLDAKKILNSIEMR